MRRAAIVNPVRTPVGAFGGALRPVPVETLGCIVAKETLKRSGLDPKLVEDVVFAQSYANSETPCVGRWIALDAGFPIEVPGLQTDRRCGGGLQALVTAAMMVQTGACDIVLAGGVESMSNIEYYTTDMRWGRRSGTAQFYDRLDRGRERSQPVHRFGYISGMIETAENLAKDYKITREEADAYAAESHRRAAAAWDEGRFADEVVPVPVPQRKGDPVLAARDEGVRPESTPETLSKLKAIMKEGTVTAGNAAQQNDAAAACLIVADDKLASLRLTPIAFLAGWSAVWLRSVAHGAGACAGDSEGDGEVGPEARRDGSRRNQRSVCRPGSRLSQEARVGRARQAQRQRLRHLARASDRRHGRAHHDYARARDETLRLPVRPRVHVHRRRSGHGRDFRGSLKDTLLRGISVGRVAAGCRSSRQT